MKRRALIVLALGLLFSTQAARADWTPVRRINYTNGHSYYPAAAVNSSNGVYIVWEENIVDNAEVYLRRSPDGGATWSAIMNLSANAGASMQPAIAVGSNGSVHVAWEDTAPGDKEIYYRRSTDYGDTWDPAKRISLTGGSSEDPSMAVDSQGTVHVVWHDTRPGDAEIYYKRSSAGGGVPWSADRRLSWNSGVSIMPTIAIDSSDSIHVFWHDFAAGNAQIYYKKYVY